VLIAREGLHEGHTLTDPDGNRVTLVPPHTDGVEGIAVLLAVRDEDAFRDFYGRVLGLEAVDANTYRCGDSLLRFHRSDDAVEVTTGMRGPGYRYITIQVRDVEKEHAGFIERGATEGAAPRTLGDVARISFVRDPDGNWIEVSQRASLTGPLPGGA
jgi:lactoylglutathione lyase